MYGYIHIKILHSPSAARPADFTLNRALPTSKYKARLRNHICMLHRHAQILAYSAEPCTPPWLHHFLKILSNLADDNRQCDHMRRQATPDHKGVSHAISVFHAGQPIQSNLIQPILPVPRCVAHPQQLAALCVILPLPIHAVRWQRCTGEQPRLCGID